MRSTGVGLGLLTLACFAPGQAPAAPRAQSQPSPAIFALVIGVNRSVDAQLAPLSYADDDAFRYRELFRSVGARTVLLARPDENTRRINVAVTEAQEPLDRVLSEVVGGLAAEVSAARASGRRSVLYFVFAGHGNLGERGAYLTLEDRRLTGADLDRRVLRAIGADESHLIVDACYSYLLVHGRGPGGRTREVRGFSRLSGLLEREDVGVLLSTSSARESHEWQEFQAGVFSHEVRSGLYGAADANADGQVSYREIAAFVGWANAAIPNERYRPEVFARPPRGREHLLDLRAALANRITVGLQVEPGHHLVEDQQGNRLAEFHNPRGHAVRLVRPVVTEALFVRHLGSGREYELPAGAGERRLADLSVKSAPLRARGAAHHAFSRIFSLPFDAWVVEQFESGSGELESRVSVHRDFTPVAPVWRKPATIGAFGVTALSGAAAVWFARSTRTLQQRAGGADQRRAAELNRQLQTHRDRALLLGVTSGVAAAGGLLLWFWPTTAVQPSLAGDPGQSLLVGAGGRF